MRVVQFAILLGFASFSVVNALSCRPCFETILSPMGEAIQVKRECPKLNCPGSEAPGLCLCCNRCAKQEGETCGGDFNLEGDCDKSLRCITPEKSRVNPDGSVTLEFMPNKGGKCSSTENPTDCHAVCDKTNSKNSYPVGNAQIGRTEFFDYKEGQVNKSRWFYCDCTGQGGWMVIQRKYLNSQSFDKDLRQYVEGFGVTTGDYWMGLNAIYYFTHLQPHELKITVKLANKRKIITRFGRFSIGDEKENFKLRVDASGEGRSKKFAAMHNGMEFTARDSDNDRWANGNCAQSYGGGWWFNRCTDYNLNGRLYGVSPFPAPDSFPSEDGPDRVSWEPCKGYKIVATEMAIRPIPPQPTIVY